MWMPLARQRRGNIKIGKLFPALKRPFFSSGCEEQTVWLKMCSGGVCCFSSSDTFVSRPRARREQAKPYSSTPSLYRSDGPCSCCFFTHLKSRPPSEGRSRDRVPKAGALAGVCNVRQGSFFRRDYQRILGDGTGLETRRRRGPYRGTGKIFLCSAQGRTFVLTATGVLRGGRRATWLDANRSASI